MTDAPESFAQRRTAAVTAATERELHDLRRRLLETEARLAEVPDLREEVRETQRLRARLAQRDAELEEAYALLRDARDEAERNALAAHEAERAQTVLREVQVSASWRLTAPLRAAKRWLGG